MRAIRHLLPVLVLSLLTACGGGATVVIGDNDPPPTPRPQPNPNPNPPTLNCSTTGLAAAAQSRWPVVCMLTTQGEIVVELYDSFSPVTVQNFLNYVTTNFYANTLIHRVDTNFVVQGGGFTSGMFAKSTNPPIQLEDNNGLSNLRGTLSMARRGDPNTATSQWFFNVRDNVFLDYSPSQRGYAVFGQIISGLGTLDALNALPVYVYSDTDKQPRTEQLVYWMRRIQ